MNVRGADFVVYQVSNISHSVPFYRGTLGLSYTGDTTRRLGTKSRRKRGSSLMCPQRPCPLSIG